MTEFFKPNISLPSDRKFGYFFSIVFFVFFIYFFFIIRSQVSLIFILLSFIFLAISFFKPRLLLPLNILWMKFGYFLGMIISPIIMGIIYFLIFTPLAIIMKLFKRDELNLKFSQKKTFWVQRNIKIQKENFKNQF